MARKSGTNGGTYWNTCWYVNHTYIHFIIVYFKGGYTSTEVSRKPEENIKSQYWGTIAMTPGQNPHFSGKIASIGTFACANAVQIGNEILISCGTKPWSILTAKVPRVQACESPECLLLPTSQLKDTTQHWIRHVLFQFSVFIINPFAKHLAIHSGVMDVANAGFICSARDCQQK